MTPIPIKEPVMPKIGYKGFKKGLICEAGRNVEKYELGKLHAKTNISRIFDPTYPRLCTDQGFHFCDNLAKVDQYYSLTNPDHEFAELEILGQTNGDGEKFITTAFRIKRIIPQEDIQEALTANALNLPVLRKIQTAYPNAIIAGSAMLFLRGVRLKRWIKSDNTSDLDIILPYYMNIGSLGTYGNGDVSRDNKKQYLRDNGDLTDTKRSGMDFDNSIMVLGVKTDIRIEPTAEYEFIEYQGFKYKVASLYETLAAKCRYAAKGGLKHMDDIDEMLGIGTFNKRKPTEPIELGQIEVEYPF